MEFDEEDNKVSKYSSGVNILKRIDNLWRDTHTHSRAGLFYQWNSDLDRIWLELARDLKEKSKKEDVLYSKQKAKFAEFDAKLAEDGIIKDRIDTSGFKDPTKDEQEIRNKQYQTLMSKQLFLARLENKIGKGTTLEDEDEDDV